MVNGGGAAKCPSSAANLLSRKRFPSVSNRKMQSVAASYPRNLFWPYRFGRSLWLAWYLTQFISQPVDHLFSPLTKVHRSIIRFVQPSLAVRQMHCRLEWRYKQRTICSWRTGTPKVKTKLIEGGERGVEKNQSIEGQAISSYYLFALRASFQYHLAVSAILYGEHFRKVMPLSDLSDGVPSKLDGQVSWHMARQCLITSYWSGQMHRCNIMGQSLSVDSIRLQAQKKIAHRNLPENKLIKIIVNYSKK